MTAHLPSLALVLLSFCAPAAQPEQSSPGWRLWVQAQEAMRQGRADLAIDLYEQSLAADPALARNYLGLAAAWLARADEEKACRCLTLYVAAHPEHLSVRLQYAELLHRLRRLSEARDEFERCAAEVRERVGMTDPHLIHCHSRLMKIAEEVRDVYDEHLHRGIGLYLLARHQADGGASGEHPPAEALLCRAAAELARANRVRPDEARPCWYLHQVWGRLSQNHPAARWLRAAEAAAPFSRLTPAEHRQLTLACRQRDRQAERP